MPASLVTFHVITPPSKKMGVRLGHQHPRRNDIHILVRKRVDIYLAYQQGRGHDEIASLYNREFHQREAAVPLARTRARGAQGLIVRECPPDLALPVEKRGGKAGGAGVEKDMHDEEPCVVCLWGGGLDVGSGSYYA